LSKRPEPSIRVLTGKIDPTGEVVTQVVTIDRIPEMEAHGWIYITADPDDLNSYLTWLYQRETES
jgi:hypothetical protein